MGQFHVSTHTLTMAASGGADTVRVWDVPTGSPITGYSIYINNQGQTSAAGNLEWTVLYGGYWSGGAPFASTATHNGGVTVASGTIAGSAEIAKIVYEETNMLPPNTVQGAHNMRLFSTPIVLKLVNKKASALTVYVTFTSETIANVV